MVIPAVRFEETTYLHGCFLSVRWLRNRQARHNSSQSPASEYENCVVMNLYRILITIKSRPIATAGSSRGNALWLLGAKWLVVRVDSYVQLWAIGSRFASAWWSVYNGLESHMTHDTKQIMGFISEWTAGSENYEFLNVMPINWLTFYL